MSPRDEKIPFAKPFLDREEAEAAKDVVLSGWVTQGPKVDQFETDFSRITDAAHSCAVSNCTVALSLALKAVGVSFGNVVVTVVPNQFLQISNRAVSISIQTRSNAFWRRTARNATTAYSIKKYLV